MLTTAVAIYVYNRPKHTIDLLNSLDACREIGEIPIFIHADAAKNIQQQNNVRQVREIVHNYQNEHPDRRISIHEETDNQGLANSVIKDTTFVLTKFDSVIVLEDDLIVSEDCLRYFMNALQYYQSDASVGAISGFTFPLRRLKMTSNDVYKSRTGNSWGWATWKDRWMETDWEVQDYDHFLNNPQMKKLFNQTQWGISDMLMRQMNHQIDSWAVRWDYSFWKRNLYTIYPKENKISNMGFDGSGSHCGNEEYEYPLGVCGEVVLKEASLLDDYTKQTSVFERKQYYFQKVRRMWKRRNEV